MGPNAVTLSQYFLQAYLAETRAFWIVLGVSVAVLAIVWIGLAVLAGGAHES